MFMYCCIVGGQLREFTDEESNFAAMLQRAMDLEGVDRETVHQLVSLLLKVHYINPSNAQATLVQRTQKKLKPFKPCHVGIHWIALAVYFQMSTHLPGFRSFFRFLHLFVLIELVASSIRVNPSNAEATFVQSTRMQRFFENHLDPV